MRKLFLAATGQNRGKTTAALVLLDGFRRRGYHTGFTKPVGQRTTLVDGVPGDHDDVAIVRAIIAMARSLRMRLVAEGVETAAQRAFLEREGCKEGQGYLFSKPVEATAIELLLGGTPA